MAMHLCEKCGDHTKYSINGKRKTLCPRCEHDADTEPCLACKNVWEVDYLEDGICIDCWKKDAVGRAVIHRLRR